MSTPFRDCTRLPRARKRARHVVIRLLAIALLMSSVSLGLARPAPVLAAGPWLGYTADTLNIRSAPDTTSAIVGRLKAGDSVAVSEWVDGEVVVEDNGTWGMLGPGMYVYSAMLRKNTDVGPPPPPATAFQGRDWIDVNVTQQTIAAYAGNQLLYWAVVSTGRPKYPSPIGTFQILRRVENETMTNAGLAFITDSYIVPNVRFTQYFNTYGAALHENYWKTENSPWGVPTSHGCVGMKYADAGWFWVWAKVGTPVVVHY